MKISMQIKNLLKKQTTQSREEMVLKNKAQLVELKNEIGEDEICLSTLFVFKSAAITGRYGEFLEALAGDEELFYEYAAMLAKSINKKHIKII